MVLAVIGETVMLTQHIRVSVLNIEGVDSIKYQKRHGIVRTLLLRCVMHVNYKALLIVIAGILLVFVI
jgi:hypothetical protein